MKSDPKSITARIRRCTKPYLVEGIAAGLLIFSGEDINNS